MPNTNQNAPLIGTNEAEILNNNNAYFSTFFNENRYKSFIYSSTLTTEPYKVKGNKKSVTVDVNINLQSLKKDLEENKIIRKFGL